MSNIEERYARAVANGASAADVVGAVGFAGKRAPLATALLRLFVGDNHAAHDVVRCMAEMVISRAYRADGLVLASVEATDLARSVLAWHRDGRCKPCGGHGFLKLDGAPGLSDQECRHCRGTGRIPFDRQFAMDRLELARWLAAKVEVEQRVAGAEAMRFLSEQIQL
jgi:hypothetical protein